jgi:hypothetical protein
MQCFEDTDRQMSYICRYMLGNVAIRSLEVTLGRDRLRDIPVLFCHFTECSTIY